MNTKKVVGLKSSIGRLMIITKDVFAYSARIMEAHYPCNLRKMKPYKSASFSINYFTIKNGHGYLGFQELLFRYFHQVLAIDSKISQFPYGN